MISTEDETLPQRPGETRPRRCSYFPANAPLFVTPLAGKENDFRTLWEGFRRGLKMAGPEAPCLWQRAAAEKGVGEYVPAKWGDVAERVERIGSGFAALGLKKGDRVGIIGINSASWTLSLLAAFSRSAVAVPLYDTLGANAVEYIVKDTELTVAVAANDKLMRVLEVAKHCPTLKVVVAMMPPDEAAKRDAAAARVTLLSLAEDLAYVMYTSGTTGNPKGAMLTHRNMVATISGFMNFKANVTPDDVYMSYLPLAHSLEASLHLTVLSNGGSVGYYQGDVKKLVDDILALRPTLLPGVPRVWQRIYDRVMSTVAASGFIQRSVFHLAYSAQLGYVLSGSRSTFLDSIVFNKFRARLGGRVRIIATGGAPIPKHIMECLKVLFPGTAVLQGYGMTENAACCMGTPLDFPPCGPVGCPLPCSEIKLVDVAELGYTSKDPQGPRGEVCIRGANVFLGYWRNEEETKKALDEEGWLHTGDIGWLNPQDGSFSIIDRKKNIFKLSHGEYVAAEALEMVYGKSSWVSQIFVYGSSLRNSLVAIVVPNKEFAEEWAKANGVEGDLVQICADERTGAAVLADLTAMGREGKLKGFEMVKAAHLEGRVDGMGLGFTVENDCMTVSMKLKRNALLKRYQADIDRMYASIRD
eukprot:tig00020807_g14059.t1